jgi:hypothetical protein
MLRTLEATIDKNGRVKLAESVKLGSKKRALVTILDEGWSDEEVPNEVTLLSEAALAKDWSTPEEDEAWKHLAELPDLDRDKKAKKGRR